MGRRGVGVEGGGRRREGGGGVEGGGRWREGGGGEERDEGGGGRGARVLTQCLPGVFTPSLLCAVQKQS